MNKKLIIIIAVVLIIVVLVVYQKFLKKEEAAFILIEVKRGTVVQEISETGKVKRGEEINLSFKNAGIIEKIYDITYRFPVNLCNKRFRILFITEEGFL